VRSPVDLGGSGHGLTSIRGASIGRELKTRGGGGQIGGGSHHGQGSSRGREIKQWGEEAM